MLTPMTCRLPDGSYRDLPYDEAFERWLDPEHTAVVCIDMHRGHVGPEDELPCGAPRARERIPAHDAFHAAARELGVPVIHVQHWQRHGGLDDLTSKGRNPRANWRVIYPLFLPENPLTDELNWEGTPWLDLMVEEDERDLYVRTKKRLSAFYPTDLEFLLRQLAVDNIVIDGTLTDCCVLSSAFDAANRDLRVIVPPDLTAGLSQESEDQALAIMARHVALVVDSPQVVREWAARRGADVPAGFADAATADDAVRARTAVPTAVPTA
jgi:biuret amidohydrolase